MLPAAEPNGLRPEPFARPEQVPMRLLRFQSHRLRTLDRSEAVGIQHLNFRSINQLALRIDVIEREQELPEPIRVRFLLPFARLVDMPRIEQLDQPIAAVLSGIGYLRQV